MLLQRVGGVNRSFRRARQGRGLSSGSRSSEDRSADDAEGRGEKEPGEVGGGLPQKSGPVGDWDKPDPGIVSEGFARVLRVVDTDTGQEVATISFPIPVWPDPDWLFSPDG